MAEEEGIELVVLPDLSALLKLDELVRKGNITGAKAAFARQKYEELHKSLKESIANTRKLFEEREELTRKFNVEKIELEKVLVDAQEDEAALDMLREDSEQAESEALACRERDLALQAEETDLRRAQEEFQKRIEEIEHEHDMALQPTLLQLKMDISDLHSQHDDSIAKIEELKKEAPPITRDHIFGRALKFKRVLRSWRPTCKADVLSNGVKGLTTQDQNYSEKIKELETHIEKLNQNMRETTEEHARLAVELEKVRQLTEQKEQSVAEMKKELELHSLDADQYLADRVTLDMQLKALQTDHKVEQERLVTRTTDKDKITKKVKHTENVLKQIQDTLPAFGAIKSNINMQLMQVENERKKVHTAVLEIKKDTDGRMRMYTELKGVGKEMVAQLREGHQKATELEREVYRSISLDYERQQQAGELASMRENICRTLSLKVQQLKEARERIRVSDITIGFLQKKEKDICDTYAKFFNVYNLLRSQRNKSVKLMQLSNLTILELKDKMGMLEVEVNMLQNEVLYKDKVLTKMRKEFAIIVQHRFLLRSEITQCHIALQKKKEMADEHMIEIDKLNGLLRNAEKDMESFRKQYEHAVLSRNHTGISLIDRNDELCILYEKSHAQDELLKHSEIELLKRENEIALLKPELINLERYILLCYKSLPNAVEIRKEIKNVKIQLRLTVQEGERLSKLVENPENKAHWRLLEGTDPTANELMAKLTALEFFLHRKGDQSLEKNLVLEEVTALAEDLKKQAADGYADAVETVSKMSRFQRQLRHVTTQMMATVSELSLTQATAMSLKQEKECLEAVLLEASARLANGEPPTADCEREWHHMQRRSFSACGFSRDDSEFGERRQALDLLSTAEPRPNAYIPVDNYGLPKPFGGAHPPFKPTEPGASFRHIRKPEPRPLMACEELGRALIADCAVWRDPQFQRSSHVRALRYALKTWATEMRRVKRYDIDVSRAIQACARLEQSLNESNDIDTFQCHQEQVASLYSAADAVLSAEEGRCFMTERNKAAIEASILLFGSRGVVPRVAAAPEPPVGCNRRVDCKAVIKSVNDGWQPRWPGDLGDPFEPYHQLVEQFLHSCLTFHAKALEQLSTAFALVRRASKNARELSYIRTLAGAAGISVKEYRRLWEMFTKIDYENTGNITKKELMAAMKRDKDIAAFMQLSRAKGKDGRRESFESVFNRIDSTGVGAITWEQFLYFFSSGRSLIGDNVCPSNCVSGAAKRPSSPIGGSVRSSVIPWVRRFLYSGDNKHVFIGVVTILGVGYIPWYFMTRGVKHSSHQDYMDKAEEARKARLST
ncbi:hypothetical protein SELMODRAFT_402635 [Selaginella moellendorffii]|uniref:EF-hand domain-containing protein n=2 Tax=Selaginella moellendorffii TaxID=88036 RepID=D8QMJ6_SELML|nr:hypothetical protein SELMODRAFT_402635 [Selaginella moellendorffii]